MLAWYRSLTKLQQTTLVAVVLALLGQTAYSTVRAASKISDYTIHRDMGTRFLNGINVYEGGCCYNYMPVSGLYYAPMAMVPPWAGMLGRSLIAIACLGASLWWLSRMAPEMSRSRFAAAMLTLLLTVQYIQRDMDDGGPHLIYLAMLVGGAYAVWNGREGLGAFWLGLAVAVKMTPGLMFGLFVWKRQWRLASLTAASTIFWILLPAAWMGVDKWWDAQSEWFGVVSTVASGKLTPGMIANDLRVQNQSLKLALVHPLVTYPDGSAMRLGMADWSLLDLDAKTASRIATVTMLAAFATFCWLGVRRSPSVKQDARWPIEWAGLLVMMVLLSPVTWVQHIVWVIPAAYFVASAEWSKRRGGAWAFRLLGVYALAAIVLNRGFVGPKASLVLQANHVHVFAMLVLLGLSVWGGRTLQSQETQTLPITVPKPQSDREAA